MARIVGYGGSVYIGSQLVEDCEDAWNEQAGTGVTATADTTDYKVGGASAKFVLTDAALVAITASEVVSSMDLSTYAELLFWAKCSIGLSAADFQLLIDNHALCVSPENTLDIPALTANIWKFCKVAGTFTGATAIISVGLKQAVDKGALSIWLDDIRAAKAIAGVKSWKVDYVFEVVETTGFDSGGARAYVPTLKGWSGSFEGYKDGAPLTIGSVVGLELQESSTSTQQYRGSAIITGLHPSVSVDGLAVVSYDFQGTHGLEIPTA